MKEVIIDGYRYLEFRGKLVPILDENGDHQKALQ